MSVLDRIYDTSPAFFQNIMCSVKGWLIQRRRFNDQFFEELKKYKDRDYDPEKELINFLLDVRDVPCYKNILNDDFFEICKREKGRIYKELKRFPIIDKQYVKSHSAEIVNKSCKEPVITMRTSGTTGSGLVFPCTIKMENKQWALWWRYRNNIGIRFDTLCGWFGGRTIISLKEKRPPFWRLNLPGHQIMYSSLHLSEGTVSFYHKDITRRGLKWLHGYPSSISLLASLISEKGLPPLNCVKWITTGAENLLDHHLQIIKKTFPQAIIRNHYGLTEGVANFSQDINGKWLIDDDFAYVEFIPLDPKNPQLCKIIGTGFSNIAFPLIRYDTGDLALIDNKKGEFSIIEIYGRQEDYVVLPNGVKLGRLDHIFKNAINVKEAQIHQINIHEIEIRVVKGQSYTTKDETILLNEARSRFGEEVKIIISYVPQIERTKAGKFKFVVSDLKK